MWPPGRSDSWTSLRRSSFKALGAGDVAPGMRLDAIALAFVFQSPRCGRCGPRARISQALMQAVIVSKPSVRAMWPPGSVQQFVMNPATCFKALGAGDVAPGRTVSTHHESQASSFKALGAGDAAPGGYTDLNEGLAVQRFKALGAGDVAPGRSAVVSIRQSGFKALGAGDVAPGAVDRSGTVHARWFQSPRCGRCGPRAGLAALYRLGCCFKALGAGDVAPGSAKMSPADSSNGFKALGAGDVAPGKDERVHEAERRVSKPSVRAMRPPGSLCSLQRGGRKFKALGAGDVAPGEDCKLDVFVRQRRFKALGAGDVAPWLLRVRQQVSMHVSKPSVRAMWLPR